MFNVDDTKAQDPDNFSTFRPKCTRYNPPGAPGSYVSRFTSHMKLIIRLRKNASPINTAFLMCAVLLDFMAYISYVSSPAKFFPNTNTNDRHINHGLAVVESLADNIRYVCHEV